MCPKLQYPPYLFFGLPRCTLDGGRRVVSIGGNTQRRRPYLVVERLRTTSGWIFANRVTT